MRTWYVYFCRGECYRYLGPYTSEEAARAAATRIRPPAGWSVGVTWIAA
ncbi:MAG: hypothetical protein H5U04_12395 [Firmicutes bacterium]|nr:hypothetical protein [Bacillota bacterium]